MRLLAVKAPVVKVFNKLDDISLSDELLHGMIVKVIEENPSRVFYESLGAHIVDRLEIKIAGAFMHEIVYGWSDLKQLQKVAERAYEK